MSGGRIWRGEFSAGVVDASASDKPVARRSLRKSIRLVRAALLVLASAVAVSAQTAPSGIDPESIREWAEGQRINAIIAGAGKYTRGAFQPAEIQNLTRNLVHVQLENSEIVAILVSDFAPKGKLGKPGRRYDITDLATRVFQWGEGDPLRVELLARGRGQPARLQLDCILDLAGPSKKTSRLVAGPCADQSIGGSTEDYFLVSNSIRFRNKDDPDGDWTIRLSLQDPSTGARGKVVFSYQLSTAAPVLE